MDFNLLNHIRKNDGKTVIWIYNIGTERFWNGKVFTVRNNKENIIVNHMEEMVLLLAREQDIVVLSVMPDENYLREMSRLKKKMPRIICPMHKDESKTISELVLEDETFKSRLDSMIKDRNNTILVPYGVSELEERIANMLNIPLFGASSRLCKRINNKVFSRKVAINLKFNRPKSQVCSDLQELEEVSKQFLNQFNKIVIKEPCGASGQGIWVIDSLEKLKSVLLIIKRFFKPENNQEWLVEEWCDKKTDINYQVYIGSDGDIDVFSIKEQIVNEMVYVGSVMPPRISEDIIEECKICGQKIGEYLYKMGYVGVLGIDAVILKDNTLIPIIEINGRFTLSTYLSFILDSIPDKCMFGFYKKIALNRIKDYSDIVNLLLEEHMWINNNNGVFVYTSETINKERTGDYGRMFAIVLGSNMQEIDNQYKKLNTIMEIYNNEG